jgi:hypothetical protein
MINSEMKHYNDGNEQLAILRALEYTENIQTEDKTATIYADNQMTYILLKITPTAHSSSKK